MSDKDDLTASIEELAKARRDKEALLKTAVKITSENRRKAREQSNRPA